MPNKKKPPVQQTKSKVQTFSKDQLELEALKDKIVECENKDASICELREQLEELKEQLSLVKNQQLQLGKEKEKYEETILLQKEEYSKRYQKVVEEFEEALVMVKVKEDGLTNHINVLKNEIEILKKEHQKNIMELEENNNRTQLSYQQLIKEHTKIVSGKEEELNNKEKELKILEKECANLQREHSFEMEKIRKAHQLEIQDIEFEFLKTMTELQNEKDLVLCKLREIEERTRVEVEQMQKNFYNDKITIIDDYERRLKEVSEYKI